MKTATILILTISTLLLATGCDRDHSHAGPCAHRVPDTADTGLIISVVVLALLCAALVEKWMRGDK